MELSRVDGVRPPENRLTHRHMDKTPNEYIRWRYAGGEDREAIAKDTMKISDAELELQKTVRKRRPFLRHQTRPGLVSLSISGPFGPNRPESDQKTTHDLVSIRRVESMACHHAATRAGHRLCIYGPGHGQNHEDEKSD